MGGVDLKAREASDNDGTLTRLGSTRSSSAERNKALLMATTVYCERNGSFVLRGSGFFGDILPKLKLLGECIYYGRW